MKNEYNKNEILSFYLNNIYFGDNQYTLEGAANHYFGTTVNKNSTTMSHITVLQSAILASKVNAPSVYIISIICQRILRNV